LDWNPNAALSSYSPGEGGEFRVYAADNGAGVARDYEWKFLRRGHEADGALFGHVVKRSKTWCSEVRFYTRSSPSSPVRWVDLYQVDRGAKFCTVEDRPASMPETIWSHFIEGGSCLEFVFTILPIDQTCFF
jgi:hypothetical protein